MTAKEYIQELPKRTAHQTIDDEIKASFNFQLAGDTGGDYAVIISDGLVTVSEQLVKEPSCEVKADAETFMKVVNKELNPMMAILTGKVKISNQAQLIKFAKILGVM